MEENSSNPLSFDSRKSVVLLAEDNIINQKVIQRMLARLGYEVMIANNGKIVLEIVEQEQIDLILMDCHMPIIDGLEATVAIRKRSDQKKDTPILALSAEVEETSKQICLESGMDDFVMKPVELDELKAKLEAWLGKRTS